MKVKEKLTDHQFMIQQSVFSSILRHEYKDKEMFHINIK